MKKYAFLISNSVVSVQELEDEQFVNASKQYEMAVDVSDYLVLPAVGYVLSGNKVVPAPGMALTVKDMIKARIRSYRARAPELLLDIYAGNTLSGMTTAQSDALFELHQDVIFCLNEGAWPTAIYRLNAKAVAGLITQEVANSWIAIIQAAS